MDTLLGLFHSLFGRKKFPVILHWIRSPSGEKINGYTRLVANCLVGDGVWQRFFPVFYPFTRELNAETGSHLTLSTAKPSKPFRRVCLQLEPQPRAFLPSQAFSISPLGRDVREGMAFSQSAIFPVPFRAPTAIRCPPLAGRIAWASGGPPGTVLAEVQRPPI